MGWFVTIAAGFISYPIDTIRRGLILTADMDDPPSTSEFVSNMISKAGLRSLWAGSVSNMVRSIVAAGAFSLYDIFVKN